MGWAWWLLAPLLTTLLAALVIWLAGRPRRAPTSEEAVSSHRRFLDDLADATLPAHRAVDVSPPTRTTGTSGSSTDRADKLPE